MTNLSRHLPITRPLCLFTAVLFAVLATAPLRAANPKPKSIVAMRPVIDSSQIESKVQKSRKQAQQTAQQVDQRLASELPLGLVDGKGRLSAIANDEVFLRRIYLDFLGRNPTPEEVTAFALDPSADKRANIADRLLADEAFGLNWGLYWRDVILYRRSDDRGQIAGPAMAEYLTAAINKNTPWDTIARSFITAIGDVRENGATGLIMAQDGDTANITSEVSRIFTGVQIQCAQCHDHKTDRWKREQFHQLAAFFPRVAVRPVTSDDKRSFEVVGVDRQRLAPRAKARPGGKTEHFMPDLNDPSAEGTKMDPVFFVTGQRLQSGATDAQRRQAIADWLTAPKNPWFAQAFVNRIWAELVGEGFYEPIDDLGPDRKCSAPHTTQYLADAFVDSKYDIKQLYRTIAATAAYQRESRPRRTPGETPFECNCPQRLRGDQLYNALTAALGLAEPASPTAGRAALLRGARNQFNQVFGFDPSQPRDDVVGTIPQALLLMNGPAVNQSIKANRRSQLGKLLSSTQDNEAVAIELYLRCLGREPNKTELETCLAHVKKTANRAEAFEDVLWALLNSTEFLYRK